MADKQQMVQVYTNAELNALANKVAKGTATEKERQRYALLMQGKEPAKAKALQEGSKAAESMAQEQQRVQSAGNYTAQQAQAINASKQAGQQAVAAQQQQFAAAENAKYDVIKDAQDIATGRQATQNAAQQYMQQQQNANVPVSEFDTWLNEYNNHLRNYLFFKQVHPEAAKVEYDAMSAIAKKAQAAGIYNFAKKQIAFGMRPEVTNKYAPLFYNTYDDYLAAKKQQRVNMSNIVYSSPGADVYVVDQMLSGKLDTLLPITVNKEAYKVAVILLEATKEAGLAIEDFNNEMDRMRVPDDYDYTKGNSNLDRALRRMSAKADKLTNTAELLNSRIPEAFKSNGDAWKGAFLYAYYSYAPSFLALSPEDLVYAEQMVKDYGAYAKYMPNNDALPGSNKSYWQNLKTSFANVGNALKGGTTYER